MSSLDAISRQKALRKLLLQRKLSTQDELRSELEAQRFPVTQSTISRDLRRLGAIRAVDAGGRTVYRLADESSSSRRPSTAASLDDLIIEFTHNKFMIIIHTTPGSASLVAHHLDQNRPGNILGTIAGDDTIFVAPADPKKIPSVIRAIQASLI